MTWLSDAAVRHLQQVATWPDLRGTKYRAVEELGRGGMGTVYLARDDDLQRDVALKVINAEGVHEELAARLRREARVLAQLEHPGIVPVHDVGVLSDGRAYYVMKFVRGDLLLDYAPRLERLDARLGLFERICEAVAFAHARRIVHRDLKPSNVMVGAFGEVLVMDWGLATHADAENTASVPAAEASAAPQITRSGAIVGTPGYMPPEQRTEGARVDARADVYALGGILFAIISGRHPPESADDAAAELKRLSGVRRRLLAICGKAMAAAATDRYPDAARLGDDVARFRADLAVAACPETPLERVARLVTHHRTAILLVLGYLIMRAIVAWSSRPAL